ncbi:siderophore-interacting protein [Rhodococcus sp. R1101]|uniref:siderophore-interacting protein n=1 Tax=Rhodococcus sp. R1101 TaxID=1170698 RepID=UPI0003197E1C|nr:siderophore-interacting protein [Rhodococcus sp. R1101]
MARSLRPIEVFPITTRYLKVLRVTDVSPGMRRVTLGGEQLQAHVAPNGYPVEAFRSDGVDDEFKLMFKHPDLDVALGPTQSDGVVNWPRDPKLLMRTYTVRRWDPVAGEIDVDFVRHGVGPASSWSYRAEPGETIQIAGPKSSAGHPQGVDWTLVAGDETALPAIGRWLENWPAGARGQVFVEIADDTHRQDLPVPDGVELTWLGRDGAEPGTTTLLFDAVTNAEWWDGKVFAWVAGEALTLTPIRRWLRNEKGLPKEQVEVTGYWRRQEVAVSEADASLPDFEATEDERDRFDELAEIAPGFALRVAATIGLAAAFDASPRTVDELAVKTGADRTGLGRLLRYLVALGVAEDLGEGRFRLTGVGRELEDDHHIEELRLDGVHAQRELAGMLALLAAVRTGHGDDAERFGKSFAQRVADDIALSADRYEQEAEMAAYFAGALVAKVPTDVSTMVVAGEAAGSYAHAFVTANPSARATVVAAPSEIEVLRRVHGEHERVAYAPGSMLEARPEPVDAVLLTGRLNELPDADAVHVLQQAAAGLNPGGRILVFGNVLDENAGEHDYEDDLVDFALSGGGGRTHEDHVALFEAAGLAEPERTTVGWGMTLYTSVGSTR